MAVQQPSVNAGLRPPPSAADGVDRGLPDSRWHLIVNGQERPAMAGKSCARVLVIAGFTRIRAAIDRQRGDAGGDRGGAGADRAGAAAVLPFPGARGAGGVAASAAA